MCYFICCFGLVYTTCVVFDLVPKCELVLLWFAFDLLFCLNIVRFKFYCFVYYV